MNNKERIVKIIAESLGFEAADFESTLKKINKILEPCKTRIEFYDTHFSFISRYDEKHSSKTSCSLNILDEIDTETFINSVYSIIREHEEWYYDTLLSAIIS